MAGMTLEDITACMALFKAAKAVSEAVTAQRFGPIIVPHEQAQRLVEAVEAVAQTCDW